MSQQNQLSVQRKQFVQLLEGDQFKAQLALALPKHVTADRLLRIALTAMNKVPALYECDSMSIMQGIMTAGQLGLEIDGTHAALVPFNDRQNNRKNATLIIGYQGFIKLAYNHPLVKGIRAKCVFAKDKFVYDEGLVPKLEHTPSDEDDPGPLVHAYAICSIEGGGFAFVVIGKREIKKAMAASRRSGEKDSPWVQHPEAMWMKTAIRRLAPFMPKSSEMNEALLVDSSNQKTIDINMDPIPQGNVGLPGAGDTTPETPQVTDKPPTTTTEAARKKQAEKQPANPPKTVDVDTESNPLPGAETEKPKPEPTKEKEPEKPQGPTIEQLRKEVLEKSRIHNLAKSVLVGRAVERFQLEGDTTWEKLSIPTLQRMIDEMDALAKG